jgi:hypothetical protein
MELDRATMVQDMTEPRDIKAIFEDGTAIDAALALAALAARREAQAHGRPLIVWQDGRVVEHWPDGPQPLSEPIAP